MLIPNPWIALAWACRVARYEVRSIRWEIELTCDGVTAEVGATVAGLFMLLILWPIGISGLIVAPHRVLREIRYGAENR